MDTEENISSIDLWLNKIHCGDCLEMMKQMPDQSIDLVVTSPPYNLKNSSGRGLKHLPGGKWKKPAMVKGYSDHVDASHTMNTSHGSANV